MCARSTANTFWRRSAARSSRVFTALWTWRWSAILKLGAAFFVSVARGLVISGALILLLPEVLGPAAIWWAMPVTELPVTELLVACYAVSAVRRATRALPSC